MDGEDTHSLAKPSWRKRKEICLRQFCIVGGFDITPLMIIYCLGAFPIVLVVICDYSVRFEFCTIFSSLCLTSILTMIISVKKVCKNDSRLFHINAIILVLQIVFVTLIIPIVTVEELIAVYALISCTQINHLYCLCKLYDNLSCAETLDPTNYKHLIESSNVTHKSTKEQRNKSCLTVFCEYWLLVFCLSLAVMPIVLLVLTDCEVGYRFYTFAGIWCVISTIIAIIATVVVRKNSAGLFLLYQVVLLFQIFFIGMTIPILKTTDFLALFLIVSATHVGRYLDLFRFYGKLETMDTTAHACTKIVINPA